MKLDFSVTKLADAIIRTGIVWLILELQYGG